MKEQWGYGAVEAVPIYASGIATAWAYDQILRISLMSYKRDYVTLLVKTGPWG